jgi:hypothetical protein
MWRVVSDTPHTTASRSPCPMGSGSGSGEAMGETQWRSRPSAPLLAQVVAGDGLLGAAAQHEGHA